MENTKSFFNQIIGLCVMSLFVISCSEEQHLQEYDDLEEVRSKMALPISEGFNTTCEFEGIPISSLQNYPSKGASLTGVMTFMGVEIILETGYTGVEEITGDRIIQRPYLKLESMPNSTYYDYYWQQGNPSPLIRERNYQDAVIDNNNASSSSSATICESYTQIAQGGSINTDITLLQGGIYKLSIDGKAPLYFYFPYSKLFFTNGPDMNIRYYLNDVGSSPCLGFGLAGGSVGNLDCSEYSCDFSAGGTIQEAIGQMFNVSNANDYIVSTSHADLQQFWMNEKVYVGIKKDDPGNSGDPNLTVLATPNDDDSLMPGNAVQIGEMQQLSDGAMEIKSHLNYNNTYILQGKKIWYEIDITYSNGETINTVKSVTAQTNIDASNFAAFSSVCGSGIVAYNIKIYTEQ